MNVSDVVTEFDLKVFAGRDGLNNEISGGYVSDLLSDVMGNASEGQIWITLQTHKNVVAIASLRDLAAVIFVKGYEPDAETIEAADIESVPLLGTCEKTFEMSGKLFNFIGR